MAPSETRELAKALLCIVLALGSLGVFAAVSGRPWETVLLRRSVVAVSAAKAVLILALYGCLPATFFGSDAAIYYLPETLRWLAGEIPYRDFRSAYSPLFHLLLIPGVLLWPHPGSVVATLFSFEIALIALYARRFGRARPVQTWRVLFLYAWSPISFYWVAVAGYNSVLIALFTLIALLLAEARKDVGAGLAALLGLAFSKLTMVMAWPAIVFFPRGSAARRMAPLLALAALLPPLLAVRIDLLADALHGRYNATSGNVWFLVSAMLSEKVGSSPIKLASMLTLLCSQSILLYAYLRHTRSVDDGAFDRASAFYSACALVFMLVAYKTYPWYLPMCLIFLLHTLVRSGRSSVAALIPFAVLGCLTTLEPALSVGLRSAVGEDWLAAVVAVDLVVVACIGYYAWLCIRIAVAAPSIRIDCPD